MAEDLKGKEARVTLGLSSVAQVVVEVSDGEGTGSQVVRVVIQQPAVEPA